jgi:hypothetical protein
MLDSLLGGGASGAPPSSRRAVPSDTDLLTSMASRLAQLEASQRATRCVSGRHSVCLRLCVVVTV